MKNKKLFFLINGPIWLAILLYTFLTIFSKFYYRNINGTSDFQLKINLFTSIAIFVYLLASFYVFYSFLVPKYLFKNKKLIFAILSGIYVVVIGPALINFLLNLSGLILNLPVIFSFNSIKLLGFNEFLLNRVHWLSITFACGFFGYIFRLAYNSFRNEQLKKELEIKNYLNEIKVIKSQLNPHFLFNTLNNIDTLIQSKPAVASVALTKLSDILRYLVYETENEMIPVKTEVENLEKYIDLEKMRLVNPDMVSFTCSIKNDFKIPSMLFFPFVENAFKHSNLNTPNQKLQISINEDNFKLLFICLNSVNEDKQNKDFKGVGLELARKRLDLFYPNHHKLSVKKENNIFKVSLQIDLNL